MGVDLWGITTFCPSHPMEWKQEGGRESSRSTVDTMVADLTETTPAPFLATTHD
jgi:hypothetical protein